MISRISAAVSMYAVTTSASGLTFATMRALLPSRFNDSPLSR